MTTEQLLATIRVRNDNVIVRIDAAGEVQRASGIIIPATANSPRKIDAVHATVLKVGPGHYGKGKLPMLVGEFVPTAVQPGDRVLLDSALAGDYVNEKVDPSLRIVRESEIHAVLDERPESAA